MNRASQLYLLLLLLSSVPADAEEVADSVDNILREVTGTLASLPSLVASEQVHGRIGVFGIGEGGNEIVVDLGRVVVPDEVVVFPARIPTENSGGFPPGLEVEVSEDTSFSQPIRLGRWVGDSPESRNRLPFLRIAGNGASGRFVRVRILKTDPDKNTVGEFATLGEIVVLEKGINAALHRPVTIGSSIENPPRWQISNLSDGYLWCLPLHGLEAAKSNGYHSRIETSGPDSPKWVEVDLGEDLVIDEVHLVAAHPRDYADTAGFGFPPRFRITGRSSDGAGIVLFDSGPHRFPNPGAAPVMIPGEGATCRVIRVETGELWRRTNDYIFALAELQVWSDGKNVALGKPVAAADATRTGRWSPEALVDGYSSRGELLAWTTWLDAISERERLHARADELSALIQQNREQSIRRWLSGAALVTVLIAFAAVLVILRQRRRAALAEEHLKRRIAGDLHDELGASLSHLALQSDLARSRIAGDDPIAARLTALSEAARETLDNMRDMVWLLAPVAGTWDDLESRLENISERILDGVEHHFNSEGPPPPGSPPIEWAREIVLFLKEALTNARRHARPGSVSVHLRWSNSTLKLEIVDDGSGFDSQAETGRGRGLLNFQTRAKALNGNCHVESSPGSGTTITLEIPLPRL